MGSAGHEEGRARVGMEPWSLCASCLQWGLAVQGVARHRVGPHFHSDFRTRPPVLEVPSNGSGALGRGLGCRSGPGVAREQPKPWKRTFW